MMTLYLPERFKVNSDDAFFGLEHNPLEKHDPGVSTNRETTAARARLAKVLNSLLPGALTPFAGYRRSCTKA